MPSALSDAVVCISIVQLRHGTVAHACLGLQTGYSATRRGPCHIPALSLYRVCVRSRRWILLHGMAGRRSSRAACSDPPILRTLHGGHDGWSPRCQYVVHGGAAQLQPPSRSRLEHLRPAHVLSRTGDAKMGWWQRGHVETTHGMLCGYAYMQVACLQDSRVQQPEVCFLH